MDKDIRGFTANYEHISHVLRSKVVISRAIDPANQGWQNSVFL